MTQEEKQLLLKDLSARLPYGVQIHYHWSREGNTVDEDRELDFSDVETLKYNIENPQDDWCEISWKPYLRPMSSMTDEERNEFDKVLKSCNNKVFACSDNKRRYNFFDAEQEDFMNAHHFDYRGLIEKGLALEATEGMYKTE